MPALSSLARGFSRVISCIMSVFRYILFLAVLLSYARSAEAVVYQYFDDQGTLIITNVLPGQKPPPRLPYEKAQSAPVQKFREADLDFRNDVSYDFYPVRAHTFQEAVMATNMYGPFDNAENKRFAAQTRWNVGWAYKMDSNYRVERRHVYASLKLYDVEFSSNITVLLPALTEDSALSDHDFMLWEEFVRGLLAHEHDHVALIRDASYREDAIRNITSIRELTLDYNPAAVTEDAIRDAVQEKTAQIGHALIREIKERNDEYDRVTEHGLKPGMRQEFFR